MRVGKKTAAIWTSLTVIVFGPLPMILRLVGWFPANGSPLLLPILATVNTTLVALFIIASILVASMIADVVEDNEIGTGRRSEGVFFAANAFVLKSVSGIGIFASTLLLNAIGFPRGVQPSEMDPAVVRSLALIYVPVFIALMVGGLGCLTIYRISRADHEANLQRLGRGETAAVS
jgi:Na+/melibiose symporter-like transporter